MEAGFKFGKNGVHSARSMMIEDLKTLLFSRVKTASMNEYQDDVINFNILHKPTEKSRKLSFRHLVDLYALSLEIPLFNVLRQWWDMSAESQPIIRRQLTWPLWRQLTWPIGNQKIFSILYSCDVSFYNFLYLSQELMHGVSNDQLQQ